MIAQKVRPLTSNYYWLKAVSKDDPFIEKLLWTCSWHHYSPAYQWRGSTQRAPCRNKEAEEEASAFPPPCRDEPPTGNTESSARLITSSKTPQTRQFNQFILGMLSPRLTLQFTLSLKTTAFVAYTLVQYYVESCFTSFTHICSSVVMSRNKIWKLTRNTTWQQFEL